jgi:hypothetical protein
LQGFAKTTKWIYEKKIRAEAVDLSQAGPNLADCLGLGWPK